MVSDETPTPEWAGHAEDDVLGGSASARSATAGDEDGVVGPVRWGSLSRVLAMRAERMPAAELNTCLAALLGPPPPAPASGGEAAHTDDDDELTASTIIGTVLGFSDER